MINLRSAGRSFSIVVLSFLLIFAGTSSFALAEQMDGPADAPAPSNVNLIGVPATDANSSLTTNEPAPPNPTLANTDSSDGISAAQTAQTAKDKLFYHIREDLTTQEYVEKYLELANGDADAAWSMAYQDRHQEGYQNLQRRDAEHYLWSKQDVDGNSYQWAPSMIRTTGYSIVKIGQYWGIKGVNGVRKIAGAKEISNTTRPTIDEFMWGIKGSNDALFGTGN
jgi:hypothetical protein